MELLDVPVTDANIWAVFAVWVLAYVAGRLLVGIR